MKSLFLGFLLSAGFWSLSFSFMCDGVYRLQYVEQTILTGSNANFLTRQKTNQVTGALIGLDILNSKTKYKILSGFTGACNAPAKKPLTYSVKPALGTVFSSETDSAFVMLYANPLTGTDFDYWFGFSQTNTGPLTMAVGTPAVGQPFRLWYGVATFVDSTRDPNSGLWSFTSHFFQELFTNPDSAKIDSAMLKTWRSISFGANRHGFFTVQFMKAVLDTAVSGIRPVPITSISSYKPSSGYPMVSFRSQAYDRREFGEVFSILGTKIPFQKAANGRQPGSAVYFEIPELGKRIK